MARAKLIRPLLLSALMVVMPGCGAANRGVESIHIPTVRQSNIVFDVPAYGRGLSDEAQQSLNTWFQSIRLRYGDRITVDDPAAVGSEERKRAIAAVVSGFGLLLDETAPVTEGVVPTGTVRVIVTRATATVDECPDWSRPSQPEFEASTASNYGCANNSNLAAMIADPHDLLSGQPYSGSDAARAVSSVRKLGAAGGSVGSTSAGGN